VTPSTIGVRRGLFWFWVIVGLSVLNTFLLRGGEDYTIIGGLTFTQAIDSILMGAADGKWPRHQTAILIAGSVVYVLSIAAFVLAASLGKRGHRWAVLLGIGLYAVDACNDVLSGYWDDLLAHAFILYMLWQGLVAMNKLLALKAAEPDSEPPMPSSPA
jgi:hypothetical protein